MDLDLTQALLRGLIFKAWRTADLRYKLKRCQSSMLSSIELCGRFMFVIKCARRLGKSYLLVLLSITVCLRKPYAQVRYAAPTAKSVRKIIRPLIRKILEDCPPELKPKWDAQEGMYVFPNGSELHVAGVNSGHADDLRGTACDLFVIDEAGTVDDLHYLIHDVALPQLLDQDLQVVAGRRLIAASSPPRTPAHEFTKIAQRAELEGNYAHYDIFAGEYSDEILRMFFKEDGLSDADLERLIARDFENIQSTTVKREYLAMDVVDENFALCREWDVKYEVEFKNDEFFPFYFKYDALDIGVRHFSVNLFAHYDFQKATCFVHDEVTLTGPEMTTETMAEKVREGETRLFGLKWESYYEDGKQRWKSKSPNRAFSLTRISDVDLLLVNDMSRLHGLYYRPTDKGSLEEMVNNVRIWVKNGRLIVHPRCKQLIGCLKYGVWNDKRTEFEESTIYGHFDAFAALMYLLRNIDQTTNPIPPSFGKPAEDHWIAADDGTQLKNLKKMFNVR